MNEKIKMMNKLQQMDQIKQAVSLQCDISC